MNLKYIFIVVFCAVSINVSEAAPEKIEYPLHKSVEKKYRVGLILFNASNKKIVETRGNQKIFYTPKEIGDAYFNDSKSVNHFIQTISYGKVGFEGTVLGWIDLPVIKSSGEDIWKEKDIYGEMIMQHLDLTKYDIFVLHFLTEGTQDNRGWSLDNSFLINKRHYYAGLTFMTNSPFVLSGESIYPSDVWAHEIIHTLGIMGHALSLDCDRQILSKSCTIVPYGNVFSIMGEHSFGNHLDTTMMEDLKWLTKESVNYTTASGKYILDAIETPSLGKKAVVIPFKKPFEIINKKTGRPIQFSKLRVEYRKPIQYDELLNRLDDKSYFKRFYTDSKAIQKNGVLVSLDYLDETVQSTVLLDMNPTTSFSKQGRRMPGNTGKFADSILPIGETKSIDDLGIKISALREFSNDRIEIEVQMDPSSAYLYDKDQPITSNIISPLTAKKDELFSTFSTSLMSTFKDTEGRSVYIVKMNIINTDLLGREDHLRLRDKLKEDAKKYPHQNGMISSVLYYYSNHQNIPDVSNLTSFAEAMSVANKSKMNAIIVINRDGTIISQ